MSIWDEIANGLGNVVNSTGSALSKLGNLVTGTDINAVNGIRPLNDQDIFTRLAIGAQGPNGANNYVNNYLQQQSQQNLKNVGADLASGKIDNAQYMKSIAQYDPETYNKMQIAQMQSIPAPIKIINNLDSLQKAATDAYANGDLVTAQKYAQQANDLKSILPHADSFGFKPFTLPTGNPQTADSFVRASEPINDAVTTQQLPPLPNKAQLPAPSNLSGAEKAVLAAGGDISDSRTPQATTSVPHPPEPQEGQSAKQYDAQLKKWELDNANYVNEQKASGTDTVKYTENLTNEAKQAINLHQTIAEMRDAQQKFQSGAFAPAQATVIKYARAVGLPVSKDDIANLSNQQVFTKLTNDIITQQVKAAGQGSRLLGEFNAIKSSNPGVGMEPESLNMLFDHLDQKAGEVTNEAQAWNQFKDANPTASAAQFVRQYTANRSAAQDANGGHLPSTATSKPSASKVIDYKEFFK